MGGLNGTTPSVMVSELENLIFQFGLPIEEGFKKMNKKGKAVSNGWIYFGVFLLAVVVLVGGLSMFGINVFKTSQSGLTTTTPLTPTEQAQA